MGVSYLEFSHLFPINLILVVGDGMSARLLGI